MVDIHITGVHVQISDKMKGYIQEKLTPLTKYHSGLSKLHVTVHQAETKGFRVDVDMHLPHGRDVVAHDLEDTFHSAIDVVHDKCAAQLRKIHAKLVSQQKHPH